MNSETFPEQLSRVRQMAKGEGDTWDLSANDHAALKAVVWWFDQMRELLVVGEWKCHIDGAEFCWSCGGAVLGDMHRPNCRLQQTLRIVNS
jgi:hypothetical protein